MHVVVISKGAHKRNVHMPDPNNGPYQYAHQWDAGDPEDCPHQAQNFLTYAKALGNWCSPCVLLPDRSVGEGEDRSEMNCHLADWVSIVGSAMDTEVEIR
jgi:hypothetical protein